MGIWDQRIVNLTEFVQLIWETGPYCTDANILVGFAQYKGYPPIF